MQGVPGFDWVGMLNSHVRQLRFSRDINHRRGKRVASDDNGHWRREIGEGYLMQALPRFKCLRIVLGLRSRILKSETKMHLPSVTALGLFAQGIHGAAVLRFGCSSIVVERLDP